MSSCRNKSICYVATTGKCLKLFLLPQAKYLAQNGWQVTVVASEDATLRAELLPNMRYEVIPMRRGVATLGLFLSIWRLYKLFRTNNFTFVQYFMPNAAFYASIASYFAKTKHRYYQLGGLRYSSSTGIKRRLLILLDRTACWFSTKVIILSQGNLEQAESDKLFPKGKGKIIGHGGSRGVNLDIFDLSKKGEWRSEVRTELAITESDIVIGFAGSIRKDKGCEELILAFEKLQKMGKKSLKLVLLGDLDYYDTIDITARNFAENSTDVIFVPAKNSSQAYLKYEDMPKYMSCWDILGFPSYREGLPNVVIEAEALAIPVVVSNVPGANNALIPEKTGLLVTPQSVDSLVDELAKLIDSKELRDCYGKQGRKFIEECFEQTQLLQKILAEKEEAL